MPLYHPLGNENAPTGTGTFGFYDGVYRGGRTHEGVDLGGALGDPVYASAGGTVTHAGYLNDSAGQVVVVDHGNGFSTHYFHLSSETVKKGDKVTANQIIGKVGATGNADGAHLHYEVRKGGTPVDPLAFGWLGGDSTPGVIAPSSPQTQRPVTARDILTGALDGVSRAAAGGERQPITDTEIPYEARAAIMERVSMLDKEREPV
jgi:murein DD-endopeptidase MepM/ murein hydrolase activator NlpD